MPKRGAPSLSFFKAPRRLRWIRLIFALLAVVSFLCIILTLQRNFDLRINQKFFVGIGSGAFQFGFNEERYWFTQNNTTPDTADDPWFDLVITPAFYTDWTLAWRPFRVKTAGSTFIVAPFWPVLLSSVALAAWSHGRLAGLRAARTSSCQACGYDLTGIAGFQGSRTCPECGNSQPTAE